MWALSSRLFDIALYWQEPVLVCRLCAATHAAQELIWKTLPVRALNYSKNTVYTLVRFDGTPGGVQGSSGYHTHRGEWGCKQLPRGARPCLPAPASPSSFLRDQHELLVEFVLPYLLNKSGNKAKAQYYSSPTPFLFSGI